MHRLEEAQRRARRNQTLMALAVIDLDGFKEVNDCLGHQAGDECLLLAANAIRGAIREIDLAARLGGDEFVIIFEDLRSVPQAADILQRVVDAVAEQGRNSPHGGVVTASLGATIYPTDFAGPEILLKNADQAMYTAKRAGGNQVYLRTLKSAAPPSFGHFRRPSECAPTDGASARMRGAFPDKRRLGLAARLAACIRSFNEEECADGSCDADTSTCDHNQVECGYKPSAFQGKYRT